jgi:hypothetical protein
VLPFILQVVITSIIRAEKEVSMPTVNKIKAAIEALGEKEYRQLRLWFCERDWEKWDNQIKSDSESGKIDSLLNEALNEKAKGKLRAL